MCVTLFRWFLLNVLFISSLAAYANQLWPAAVSSAHPLATQAGIDILKKGGNAFDAAAAVTASLAVVEPYGSGLGGGGFWLLHSAFDNRQIMLDGREMAPFKSHKNMYLDYNGRVIKGLSLNGPLSAGIPGIPAGIGHLVKYYGNLSLKEVLAPAIKQAEEGFFVSERYQKLMNYRVDVIRQYPTSSRIFLNNNNNIPAIGDLIIQKDLAKTLRIIADKGSEGFYKGSVAYDLVHSVKKNGGIWELGDLANYFVIERNPIVFTYKNTKITSAALPSSGGIVLGQILNILEDFNLDEYDSLTRKHIIIEAMRRAYRDRAAYLGDADFVDVPVQRLLNKKYAQGLALTIDEDKATPSDELINGNIFIENKGSDTTHFSIIDKYGNRVAGTLSINLPFGSGFVAENTGVLLNNEMDDFSIKPLTANAYGLLGSNANAIEPRKRPLSSMTPTFIESSDRIGVLGTPGGSRIISMVLLGILDFIDGNPPNSWVSVLRYHHQFFPDEILFEKNALTLLEQNMLQNKGHVLKESSRYYGNMQAIVLLKEKGFIFAASDPRGEGLSRVIYLQ